MRILYIAQNSLGSTSNMRGRYIQEILKPDEFKVIDIDIPLHATSRIFRSFGWRFKIGVLINKINSYINSNITDEDSFNIIWIDKGVFINLKTMSKLRSLTTHLIHFTPDPAFAYHRSRLFFKTIHLYDICITTKQYELQDYSLAGAKKTLYCTQGFDPSIHKSYNKFNEKIYDIVFIGHFEKERAILLHQLLQAGFKIVLAGIHWKKFVALEQCENLIYLGDGIYGEEYAKIISLSYFGLGLLSKWVPELHTTRTFEIPACGTCLITPRTSETTSFFNDSEVVFWDDNIQLISNLNFLLRNKNELENKTSRGNVKVLEKGFDYKSILIKLLKDVK